MGTNLKLPFVHKQAPDNPKTVLPEETFISTSVVSKEARMVWCLLQCVHSVDMEEPKSGDM